MPSLPMLVFLVATCFVLAACDRVPAADAGKREPKENPDAPKDAKTAPDPKDTAAKVVKTDQEWQKCLTPMQYQVLRQKGTEAAGTGELLHNKAKGTYVCAGCGLELFSSETKFESGTGWPSFWQAIGKGNVKEIQDKSHGMARTEVVCARCEGHLGHVFDDGPQPTGLRYCMNSVSLKFVKAGEGKEKAGEPKEKTGDPKEKGGQDSGAKRDAGK